MARITGLEGPDPEFQIPASVSQHPICCAPKYTAVDSSLVDEEEFLWMEARRPLRITQASLVLDYGTEEAKEMEQAFNEAQLAHLLGVLNWPGVGTRWREFLTWCKADASSSSLTDPAVALRGFGRSLGRVTTYRALAIDAKALQSIVKADCVFPSGQLRVGSEVLEAVVNEKGVQTVCVARLFIAHLKALLGHDPSISLHDDWQTTSLIASGYASYDRWDPKSNKKVHLFEMSCPKVESVGWTLQEVAERRSAVLGFEKDHDPWFCFPARARPEGVWFDGRLQRTERYGLYGIPFLSQRLQRLLVFNSLEELGLALEPFAERQEKLHTNVVKQCLRST